MNKFSVCIVDYGVGNTLSVANAIESLGYRIYISNDSEIIKKANALILPGVGAFEAAISRIKYLKLDEILGEEVLLKSKPILGICLGMQMMANISYENGKHEGLGWISGTVEKLNLGNVLAVPHVGWNNITVKNKLPLYIKIEKGNHFYFDHSYHFIPFDNNHISSFAHYGIDIVSSVQNKNICGVQFHPEKSHLNGLRLFRSFMKNAETYA